MRNLIIRQTLSNGATRVWRLRESEKPSTLGTSRLADLTSADPHTNGLEGVFESREGQWYWLNMNPAKINSSAQTLLHEGTKLEIGGSIIECAFHEKSDEIYQKLTASTLGEVSTGTTRQELEIVKFGDRVLSTLILKEGSPESKAARDARALSGDKITVIRRPIHVGSVKDLSRMSPNKAMDKDSRRGAMIVVGCSLLFAAAALFGPRTRIEPDADLPPIPQQVTISMVPMKMKRGAILEKKMKEVEKMPAAAAEAGAPKTGGKVAGLLRAVNTGRLSKLMGKVSAQAARSKEVIVMNAGVKAGEGPSGRALAAWGKVDKGGGDWNQAATGSGLTVGTAGRGGGKSVSVGGLATGNTGNAGVGLIEDESEISGGLDRDVIAGVIKTYLGQILYCYERQLSASPDLFGKVAVRFTIGGDGKVVAQAIGDTTLKNKTVEGCILTRVASWKFPNPMGGTKVMVTYPFLFKSTN